MRVTGTFAATAARIALLRERLARKQFHFQCFHGVAVMLHGDEVMGADGAWRGRRGDLLRYVYGGPHDGVPACATGTGIS